MNMVYNVIGIDVYINGMVALGIFIVVALISIPFLVAGIIKINKYKKKKKAE